MSTYRILIIDDQSEVRHMLASALRLLGPNFDVLEAPSAEEGFLLALRGAVDLLVVDVRLPGISGLELVEKIRVRNPELKIILITGVEQSEIRQQVAKAQVDAYFYKPIVIDKFIRSVLDCLGIEQGDQMLAAGAVSVDPDEATSTSLGSPESLTERLYSLRVELKAYAALLLDHEGRVLAQSGIFPPLFSKPSALPLLIDTWYAADRFSASLDMGLPAGLMSFSAKEYNLILAQVGKLCMLLLVVPGPRLLDGHIRPLHRAQEDLTRILSALGVSLSAQGTQGTGALVEVEEQPTEVEMTEVDQLLQRLAQLEVGEDVNVFWEQAVAGDEYRATGGGGALSYDQARQLGLTPLDREDPNHKDQASQGTGGG